MKPVQKVEEYISGSGIWEESLNLLREIFLSSRLEETIKWGGPVYTYKGKNVTGMAAFKSYAGIWFYQGALLKDEAQKLVNAQEGITKALRQWRFQNDEEIHREQDLIKAYIQESMDNLDREIEIRPERNVPLQIPQEINDALQADRHLQESFEALPLSKRREFAEYITNAKQEKTKLERLGKIIPMIMAGTGLNDKYKK